MNADTFKGKWGQFKGELKRKWGKFTDDDLMQIEGNYDKFLGKVQEKYGTQKDDIAGWADKNGFKATNRSRLNGNLFVSFIKEMRGLF